jgi:hypothetical protein
VLKVEHLDQVGRVAQRRLIQALATLGLGRG